MRSCSCSGVLVNLEISKIEILTNLSISVSENLREKISDFEIFDVFFRDRESRFFMKRKCLFLIGGEMNPFLKTCVPT